MLGIRPSSDFETDIETVDIYRIEQRKRVASGIGLVASRVLQHQTIGRLDDFKLIRHMSSNHEQRQVVDATTPFVSFSSDPEHLAKSMILKYGFGLKDGSDSVIVKGQVSPNRI